MATNYNFTQINNEVLDVYGTRIGLSGYAVYCQLARFAQGSGQCWPSQETLAAQLHTTRKTIRAALKILQDVGLIEQAHRYNEDGQTSNIYRLCDVEKRPDAAPTNGVAEPPPAQPKPVPEPEDPAGDYELDEEREPSYVPAAKGEDLEMFTSDEDVLIAIADIRQRNRDYLISLFEDGEGFPTDDDYPVDVSPQVEDTLAA